MLEIAKNIYIEDGYLGPVLGACILSHGTLLIDTPPRLVDARSWQGALMNLGSGVDQLLLYLDSHLDRTLGGLAFNYPPIAHEKVLLEMKRRSTVFKNQPAVQGADWEMGESLSGQRWNLPQVTFTQQLVLHWDDTPLVITSRSGCAADACWMEFADANVIFVGDAVVKDQPPFLHRANIPVWIENLEVLLRDYKNFIVISSRGGVVSRKIIQDNKRHLKQIHNKLEKLSEKDASVNETENLIPGILSKYSFPETQQILYERRLRSGLAQIYNTNYHPQTDLETE